MLALFSLIDCIDCLGVDILFSQAIEQVITSQLEAGGVMPDNADISNHVLMYNISQDICPLNVLSWPH